MVKHILIADDDEDDRMLFSDALRQISDAIELSTAVDGIELLTMLRTSNNLPDLVFLDLNMPARNGYDSLKDIKQDPSLHHLPVIVFTTTSHHQTVDQMFALGARYYIEKPTDFGTLKDLIRTIITTGATGHPSSKAEFTKFMR